MPPKTWSGMPRFRGVELVIKGRLRGIEGRKVQVSLSLSAGGQPCARAEMLAVQFRE